MSSESDLDERGFERLAQDVFRRVLDLFDAVEPEDAEIEPSADVIRIALRGGDKIVLNTQRPARQLWLAGSKQGFHFSYDPSSQTWIDDKGRGELFDTLRRLAAPALGDSA